LIERVGGHRQAGALAFDQGCGRLVVATEKLRGAALRQQAISLKRGP
jgi:hypothetical protein